MDAYRQGDRLFDVGLRRAGVRKDRIIRRQRLFQASRGHSRTVAAFGSTRASLRPAYADVLTKCSWQRIMPRLRAEPALNWLTQEMHAKYGL
jgi:hypothetical protein